MTIGIGLICDGGKTVVGVSDEMITFGGGAFAADNVTIKNHPLGNGWFVLYSSNDIGHVPVIIDRAWQLMRTRPPSVIAVSEAMQQAYSERLTSYIEQKYLTNLKITLADFWTSGRTNL